MLAAALRLHARLLPERSTSARYRRSGNRLCYGLIVCCQQAHGKKVRTALKWRYFTAGSCFIYRLSVKWDMPKSVHDVHSPSDPRRNRWKKKHPEIFTHWEALAAASSNLCHKRRSCVSVLPPQGATLAWEWTSAACGVKQNSDYDRWIHQSA